MCWKVELQAFIGREHRRENFLNISKRNIVHVVGFVLTFFVLLMSLEKVFFSERSLLPSWRRVKSQDEPIDILVLGNSHAFTSTNAALLSCIWQKDVELFASSNQNMCQTLIHLQQALKYQNPEYIFLEVYSACLDNMSIMQNEKRGTLLQDLDGISNYADKVVAVAGMLPWDVVPEGVFQLLRPTNMWSRYNIKYIKTPKTSTTHGYDAAQTANSFATGSLEIAQIEERILSFEDEMALANYNEKALREFLALTRDKGIQVVLYKAPVVRTGESGFIRTVFDIAKEYDNVVYMSDYRQHMTEMGLSLEDFYDHGHLNKRGGELFTVYFANDIAKALSLECDWSEAWGYKGESIISMRGGSNVSIYNGKLCSKCCVSI